MPLGTEDSGRFRQMLNGLHEIVGRAACIKYVSVSTRKRGRTASGNFPEEFMRVPCLEDEERVAEIFLPSAG